MTDESASPVTDPSRQTPPLNLPYYRAPFMESVSRFFRKYATFSGRASRAEFWWATLFTVAVPYLVQTVWGATTGEWNFVENTFFGTVPDSLSSVFSVATFIPSLAITWRRLHDSNHSGAWFFISFIPVLGWIWLLVLLVAGPHPAGTMRDVSYRTV